VYRGVHPRTFPNVLPGFGKGASCARLTLIPERHLVQTNGKPIGSHIWKTEVLFEIVFFCRFPLFQNNSAIQMGRAKGTIEVKL